mmetsp:Transcript_16803/g.43150  ORF Transcript_16803/g.43150 Transcript_16803/m.43150 type:complete len:240 (-) Transcript_16803:120-839(-)
MGGGWLQKKKIADRVEGWNHEPWKKSAGTIKDAELEAKQAAKAASVAEAAARHASLQEAAERVPPDVHPLGGVPTPEVSPAPAQLPVESPEDAMKRAATDSFTTAIASGLTKEEARNVAREAGRVAYKAAQGAMRRRAETDDSRKVVEVGTVASIPVPPPAPPAQHNSAAPSTPLQDAGAATTGLAVASSAFGRAAETLDEQAARLRALAIEKAERAERAEKERLRLKATKRRVVRGGA